MRPDRTGRTGARSRAPVLWALAALAALRVLSGAAAAEFSPAIVYDFGGRFDRSYNQSASEGVGRFAKDTGVAVREFEILNATQREQAMRRFAQRGATIIVAVGFSQASAVEAVARDYPNVKFTLIDGVVDLPNVQSIGFREQESTFLCGMAAAMVTKTGKLGFVGGMDIPLVRKFAAGYGAGARYINPSVTVFINMAGTTPRAWSDPTLGVELARSQFGRGADVVFQVAGGTGIGVMQAAADAGLLSIGSDSNQDYLHPGSVLTSAVKHVDVAVYAAFATARNGTWQGGRRELGLAEDGLGYTADQYNRVLLTPERIRLLERAKADIISGKIVVPDHPSTS